MTQQAQAADGEASRFEQLSALLEQDPTNLRLVTDTANAAIEARQFAEARRLIATLSSQGSLSDELVFLDGTAAMGAAEWADAAARFEKLLAIGADAPAIRFNLAWSLAMQKAFDAALALLDEPTVATLPQAAALSVQLLHQRGDMEEAERRARDSIARFPDHVGLNAVVSTLAIDIEDRDLAAHCAQQAGDHPEALVTLATLSLGNDQIGDAAVLFDRALEKNPALPRAWIGRGLSKLLGADKVAAAADIDHGAALFDTHLGSWIAAGWAHLLAGDLATAKERFQTALSLDANFAESHGSLAVIDVMQGRAEEARRATATALRLDRQCFSAALAAMLLALSGGDQAGARQLMERALSTPVGDDGKTIAQTMARLGLAGH